MLYFAQHRGESIEFIAKYLGIKDCFLAIEVFDLQVSRLGELRYLDEGWMRGAVDFTNKSMGLNKEITPSQIFDFSFAAKALGRNKN